MAIHKATLTILTIPVNLSGAEQKANYVVRQSASSIIAHRSTRFVALYRRTVYKIK